ncbi:hypothetical protein FN846DRAFT_911896 [Sphaerosporella brunnea]|uniref:Uncharacterized protein n=1 Tax=Sphaerosporella brunnea TaxID=1250544 RepID=A0A5J5EIW3_9PEZI|nr:hypothetical protein FN846DRAFT_911896 [Sphaerosporella brunnea]
MSRADKSEQSSRFNQALEEQSPTEALRAGFANRLMHETAMRLFWSATISHQLFAVITAVTSNFPVAEPPRSDKLLQFFTDLYQLAETGNRNRDSKLEGPGERPNNLSCYPSSCLVTGKTFPVDKAHCFPCFLGGNIPREHPVFNVARVVFGPDHEKRLFNRIHGTVEVAGADGKLKTLAACDTQNAIIGLSSDMHRYYDNFLLSIEPSEWTDGVTFRFKVAYVVEPAEYEITTCRNMHDGNSDNSNNDGKYRSMRNRMVLSYNGVDPEDAKDKHCLFETQRLLGAVVCALRQASYVSDGTLKTMQELQRRGFTSTGVIGMVPS